jgi:hypothetical protein
MVEEGLSWTLMASNSEPKHVLEVSSPPWLMNLASDGIDCQTALTTNSLDYSWAMTPMLLACEGCLLYAVPGPHSTGFADRE